jgi:hypothetical protein
MAAVYLSTMKILHSSHRNTIGTSNTFFKGLVLTTKVWSGLKWCFTQCCGSGMIFFGSVSGSDFSDSFGSDPDCYSSIYNSFTLYGRNRHQSICTVWELRLLFTIAPQSTVHRVVTAAFWRTFHHEGRISPGWWGWGLHAHPLSLHLPSPVKLQCTLQLSWQIH